MIHTKHDGASNSQHVRPTAGRWRRSTVMGMAGVGLLAAGLSAAGTWALRKQMLAPDQSITFESGTEAHIKVVPQGLTEVTQWLSERRLLYGFSFDAELQIDGLMLSITPADGVVIPTGEVTLSGLVFNDAGEVIEFSPPTQGACFVIMTEDSTRPDGRRVRCVGPCDDGTNSLFRLSNTEGPTALICDCNGQ